MILVEYCYQIIDVLSTKILATYPSEDMANQALIRALQRHSNSRSKHFKVVRKIVKRDASRSFR